MGNRSDNERGQAAIEWVGALVVVAALIVVLLSVTRSNGFAGTIRHGADRLVGCVFSAGSQCSTSGAPGQTGAVRTVLPGGSSGSAPANDVSAPSPCPTGQVHPDGPYPSGAVVPCVAVPSSGTGSTSGGSAPSPCPAGQVHGSQIPYKPGYGPCVAATPPPGPPKPTANDPWITPALGTDSCPYGYDLHLTTDGSTPWCANSALDPNPQKLKESPWETNQNDYLPNDNWLNCGSGVLGQLGQGGACEPWPTNYWEEANKYYLCYDEEDGECDPPKYLPVIGHTVPGDPSSPFQIFPLGKGQEEAYNVELTKLVNEALDKLGEISDGMRDRYEAQERYELTTEALNDVSSQSQITSIIGSSDPGEPDPDPPGEGDGGEGGD